MVAVPVGSICVVKNSVFERGQRTCTMKLVDYYKHRLSNIRVFCVVTKRVTIWTLSTLSLTIKVNLVKPCKLLSWTVHLGRLIHSSFCSCMIIRPESRSHGTNWSFLCGKNAYFGFWRIIQHLSTFAYSIDYSLATYGRQIHTCERNLKGAFKFIILFIVHCIFNSDNDDVTFIVKRWHYLNLFAHLRGTVSIIQRRVMRLTYDTSIYRREQRHTTYMV